MRGGGRGETKGEERGRRKSEERRRNDSLSSVGSNAGSMDSWGGGRKGRREEGGSWSGKERGLKRVRGRRDRLLTEGKRGGVRGERSWERW